LPRFVPRDARFPVESVFEVEKEFSFDTNETDKADFTDRNEFSDVFEEFGSIGESADVQTAQPAAEAEEQTPVVESPEETKPEEWEQYLDRMTPAAGKAAPKAVGDGKKNAETTPDEPAKKSRKGLIAAVTAAAAVLLAVAAGLYVWFGTDLYYVADIALERNALDLFVGENEAVKCEVTSFGSGEPALEWSSSDSAVASVDGEGNITARSAGIVTITAADPRSGRVSDCVVRVYDNDSMILNYTGLTLGEGEASALTVQFGSDGDGVPQFSSSDSTVVSVDETGAFTAAGVGTADITVSARGYEDAVCTVTVMPAPTVMDIDVSGGMCAGESRQLSVVVGEGEYSSEYRFSSDNPAVVSVDENGMMTAQGKGSAVVTVTACSGVSSTLDVTVTDEPSSVTIPKNLTVYSGQPRSLKAKDNTGNCRQMYYTSSEPSVVSVDDNGVVTVLKKGSATVTCTTYNGRSAKCEITAKLVDYTTPYTSQMVYDNIAALQATYPEIITSESIGKSLQGRDITLLKLGTGQRKVLVVAGMHSREGIAVTFTMRCIEEYAAAMNAGKSYKGYNVKKLLSEYTIYFVPLLNPDGMDIFAGIGQPEYTDKALTAEELAEYKSTAGGVNLNRNFPFAWGKGGVNTTTADHRSYAGDSAGSEPESKAIMELCRANNFEWMLDMHCKGHLIYYQDQINKVDKLSRKLAAMLYRRYDFTLTDRSTTFEASGGLENWFRQEFGRPGICVELVGSKYSSEVNEYFETKTDWKNIKSIFLACIEEGK